jgi:hypothetical protein
MALNLSTLTNSATSGDVLAEALTTADFLESVPVLRNLARGSQKGGDAKQGTALNQPKALPYDGKGYLYMPGVIGNHASIPNPLGALDDFTFQVDGLNAGVVRPASTVTLFSQYNAGNSSFIFRQQTSGKVKVVLYCSAGSFVYQSTAIPTNTVGIRVTRVGTLLTYLVDTGSGYVSHDTDTVVDNALIDSTSPFRIGEYGNGDPLLGKMSRARVWNNGTASGTPSIDVDFTATNVRHGDTKFKCATGQVVTINQSGNDPATVIKKSVLRFDGTNDGLQGLFNQTIDSGYMFASFSVLGDGGESLARIFSANSTGAFDYQSGGFTLRRFELNHQIQVRWNGGSEVTHSDVFNGERGDFLLESPLRAGDQNSKINNADADDGACVLPNPVSSEEFGIGSNTAGDGNACIDLEYLALFPSSITDAQAADVVKYINNRNLVFLRHQTDGYYFYDAQNAPVGPITSGSSAWNGRIVGSDFGDSDRYATQSTANHQPVSDGFKVTFADNTDHLDIPSINQAGWQIVGTSLGTFVYRVNANEQIRLNLLGYRGSAGDRKAGDLYGIILLPESATGKDIQEARKMLIDRGASESVTGSSAETFWLSRSDIVEFESVDFSGVANVRFGWNSCSAMTKFNVGSLPDATNVYNAFGSSGLTSFNTDLPLALRVDFAWKDCASLASFGAVDIKNCTNFTSSWQGTSALTSFPAGAKLGTSASNVNFSSAWKSSGLTSFPALELNNGNNFVLAFDACSNLTSLETGISFSANASNIAFYGAFLNCTSLVDFPPRAFDGFGTPANDSFLNTWLGCSALSANSVENILVSIDTSGQSAPSSGPQITISYNVATGSLSAATNTAVTSLKAKGWSIIVNNVTL